MFHKTKGKRALALLLAFCMTAGILAGCSLLTEQPTDPPTQPTAPTETTAAPEETTVPETTVPETTVPETTVPETTVPETTVPEQPTEPVKPKDPTEPAKPREPDQFYVKVNCTTNTVNVFTRDEDGKFTVPYKVMVCSTGLDETPTPTGTYHLTGNRWPWLEMVGGVWGMYTTQIFGNYLFHSVPYTEYGNHGSLQEGEYDKLGEDASHGCIRLTVEDAKWIYDHMEKIREVVIYNSSNPGPLGKPMALKISGRAYPGWDPTDRTEGNPWLSGKQ